MDKDSFSKRLHALIAHLGLKHGEFAKKIDVLPQTIGAYLGVSNKPLSLPGIPFIDAIIRAFPQVNIAWLITGQGSMIYETRTQEDDKEIVTVTVDRKGDTAPVFVPMEAQAGYAEHIQAHDYAYLQKLPTVSFSNEFFNPKGKEVRIFEVRGDSMEPTFYQGDILFCTDIMGPESIKPGRVYILVTKHNGILVKRAVFHRITGEIELHSDNKFHEPFMIPAEEILEYWYFRRVFSAQAPPPDYTEDRLYRLEKEMFELKQAIIRNAKTNQREIRLD